MKALAVLAALMWLAVASAAHASGVPTFKKGALYSQARAQLTSQGYRPVRGDGSGCSFGREDVCRAYPEAEACAGTGVGSCLFLWKRGRQVVEVMTIGEQPRKLATKSAAASNSGFHRATTAMSEGSISTPASMARERRSADSAADSACSLSDSSRSFTEFADSSTGTACFFPRIAFGVAPGSGSAESSTATTASAGGASCAH